MKKLFTLFVMLVVFVSVSNAGLKTWIGGAGTNLNWTTGANWNPIGAPVANDDVVFSTAGTLTFTTGPGANFSFNSLTISAGTVTIIGTGGARTFTLGGNAGTDFTISTGAALVIGTNLSITMANNATASLDGTLTINSGRTFNSNNTGVVSTVTGTIINSGTLTCTNSSRLQMQTGSLYTHSQNGGTIPTATWATTSTCNITGTTGTVPGTLNQSFGNFTWNASGQSASITFNGALTTVNGTFRVSSTNGNLLTLTGGTNLTMTIGGDLIIENGSLLIISDGDNAAVTINIAGSYSQDSGLLDYFIGTGGGNTLNNTFSINVAGDFTLSGDGIFDFAFGDNNSSGRFTKLSVGGNFSQTGTSAIETSTSDQDITNGTITFNKSGTQTCTLVPANVFYVNFIVASGSTVQLGSNVILSSIAVTGWGGKFTVNSGGVLDAGTNQVLSEANPGVNNIFTLSSGATLKTANVNGVQNGTTATISNELSSTSLSTSADYKFNGAAAQVTTGMPATINSIEINNAAGVSLSAATTSNSASTPLILTNGILSGSTLTISSAYTGAGGGGSTSSHVSVAMAKIGSTAYEFPVGNGTVYRPVSVSSLSGSATITAQYFQANPKTAFGTALGAGVNHIGVCEYWTLDDGPATLSGIVGLKFGSSCNGNGYVNDPSTLLVAHWNGSNWESKGNDGTATSTSVTALTPSTFSPFTIGSSSVNNPLPVRISDIRAYQVSNGVQVDWMVLTEVNMAKYVVERSYDGIHFTAIGDVAALNTGNEHLYSFIDPNPLFGLAFYRLNAIDRRDLAQYSNIVRIDLTGNTDLNVYPNPVKTGDYLSLNASSLGKGNISVRIFNATGQQIIVKQFNHPGGAINQSIQLPATAKAGFYTVILEREGVKVSGKSFIVQ